LRQFAQCVAESVLLAALGFQSAANADAMLPELHCDIEVGDETNIVQRYKAGMITSKSGYSFAFLGSRDGFSTYIYSD